MDGWNPYYSDACSYNTRTSPAGHGGAAGRVGTLRERGGCVRDGPGHGDGSALGHGRGATNVCVAYYTTRSDHPGARGRGLRPQNPAGDADVMTGFDCW